MNWEHEFGKFNIKLRDFENELNALKEEQERQEKQYLECIAFTDKFLKCCSKHKIKAVCINTSNEIVKESTTFAFGCYNSVFASGNTTNGTPAIWAVCEELGISGGCGNHDQHQLNRTAMAKLVDGAYQYKDGKWNKID